MSENIDIVIVGGGPAGLAAAGAAASQGVRVYILERHNEIGYPIHTSGGSWISDMQALSIPGHLYHPITRVYFVSPQREVLLRYNPAVACVVDVRGLYQHLASRAIAAGAVLHMRHVVEQAITSNGRVLGVTARNHVGERISLAAAVTIDASGFSRHVGVRSIMGSKFAPKGYAWAFPRGNGRVRLGVGVLHPDSDEDARAYLDSVIHDLPQLAGKFEGASPIEYHTGLFPSEGPLERFSHDGLLLAGDAGGHGSTLVGEGIRFAIYSGQM